MPVHFAHFTTNEGEENVKGAVVHGRRQGPTEGTNGRVARSSPAGTTGKRRRSSSDPGILPAPFKEAKKSLDQEWGETCYLCRSRDRMRNACRKRAEN